MRSFLIKHAPILIATAVVGLVCLLEVFHSDFVERLERMTYDWRVREAGKFPFPVTTNLGFVSIGDETIRDVNDGSLGFNYGLYWPRHIYGRVVRQLSREGAAAVAFDIMFAGLRPDHDQVLMPDDSTMASDAYFALQMKRAGNVILASEKGVVPPPLFRRNARSLGDISAEPDSDGILRRARAFSTYRKWHPAFQQLADQTGVDLDQAGINARHVILPLPKGNQPMTVPLDTNGNFDLTYFVGEKLPPGMERYAKPYTEERLWHMGIVLAAQELKLDLARAQVNLEQGWILLTGANGVERTIPVDKEGYFYVNWCLTSSDERLTSEPFEALLAADQEQLGFTNTLFAKQSHPVDWRNKLVMIGSTATGNDLTDRGATPLEDQTVLVSVHWNVANSVIAGQFIKRTSLEVDLILVLIMGLMSSYLTWLFRSYVATLWIFALSAIYLVATVYLYVQYRYWVSLVPPLVGGLLCTHFCMLAFLVFFEQAQRRRIRSIFNKLVSSDVAAEVLKTEDEEPSPSSGAVRRLTIFFSDIRGFTELTDTNQEKAEAYIRSNRLAGDAAREVLEAAARDTLDAVNTYLKVITNVIEAHNGTVDKFIGDCVMAYWNGTNRPDPQHALSCVRAAIATQRAVLKVNLDREVENLQREAQNAGWIAAGQRPLPPLPILFVGTGINTGEVTAGVMGTENRYNFTVFGREVNLASRLEAISGRARIIISEETRREILKFDAALGNSCKALPPEHVKGIREAVRIYEVPWLEAAGEPEPSGQQNKIQPKAQNEKSNLPAAVQGRG